MDARSFDRISRLVHAESGIVLGEGKKSLTVSRLARRLRQLKLSDFSSYCDLLERDDCANERREMLFSLTTNVTRFFREPHHFDLLRKHVLPDLIQRAKAGGRMRIWSAGCSSGEEPYSIAMTLLDAMPDAHKHDVRILATDLDANMVAAARVGTYRTPDPGQIPDDMLKKYFDTAKGGERFLQVKDNVRALVQCSELNLLGDWPMKGKFDLIFCRNVVIYFDAATQDRLWQRFADALVPGGHLCVGHSERVSGPAKATLQAGGVTHYVNMPTDRT